MGNAPPAFRPERMSEYQRYPALRQSTVSERTKYFRHTVLQHLQTGLQLEPLAEALEDAITTERYEMAEGIAQAAEAFRRNPQLGLFASGPRP